MNLLVNFLSGRSKASVLIITLVIAASAFIGCGKSGVKPTPPPTPTPTLISHLTAAAKWQLTNGTIDFLVEGAGGSQWTTKADNADPYNFAIPYNAVAFDANGNVTAYDTRNTQAYVYAGSYTVTGNNLKVSVSNFTPLTFVLKSVDDTKFTATAGFGAGPLILVSDSNIKVTVDSIRVTFTPTTN